MFPEKRILVPLDFSPVSAEVIAAAEQLAEKAGSSLILLHAVEPIDPMRQRPPLILTDILDDYMRLIHRIPKEWVTASALEGEPVEVILDAATDNDCGTIVMGRGRQSARLGHVAATIQKRFRGRTYLITPMIEAIPGGSSC